MKLMNRIKRLRSDISLEKENKIREDLVNYVNFQVSKLRDDIMGLILRNQKERLKYYENDEVQTILVNGMPLLFPKELLQYIMHCKQSNSHGWLGFHIETPHFEWIKNQLAPGDVFFDVGANIGLFAACYAHNMPEIEAYAFEPGKRIFEDLSSVVEANELGNKVTLVNKGVGANAAKMIFEEIDASTVAREASHLREGGDGVDGGYEIDVVSIDEFCEEHGCVPNVLKIDVEGHEFEVLKGAKKVLSEFKPKLCIELHGKYTSGSGYEEIKALLSSYADYEFSDLPKTIICY